MLLAQRFAQVFGLIYVVVGIAGFIPVPPLLVGELPPSIIGPFDGLLLGLFAVNWFHSLTHLAIGAIGLAVYRSPTGAMSYALALGVAYTLLFVIGLVTELSAFGGLLPLKWVGRCLALTDRTAGLRGLLCLARSLQERRLDIGLSRWQWLQTIAAAVPASLQKLVLAKRER